jgi:two-component system sensor histidine kinase YesM
MKRKKISIWFVIMACVGIVAVVASTTSLGTQKDYQRFLKEYSEEYQWLMKLMDVRRCVRTMYDTASGFMAVGKSGWPDQLDRYEASREEALGILEAMERGLTGNERHKMRDLKNMVRTFDEHFQAYYERLQTSYSIYLRADLQYLRRLKGYIENELYTASDMLIIFARQVYDGFVSQLKRIQMRGILLTILAIAASVAVALWMGRSIARPINALVQRMRTYLDAQGVDDIRLESSTIAEIDTLEESYRMLMTVSAEHRRVERELDQQKLENTQTRSLLKSAELDMLRMQMNPHFLFNTLNSISALGEMENAPMVSEMVQKLSEILRYNMSTNTLTTPLREAISIVDNYVGILRMRFGERLEYQRYIAEEALVCPVPRMMIQPLVENSVQHGFPHIQTGNRIEIEACLEEGILVVSVRDNGVGMSEKRLESLMENTDLEHGIGLRNVITRMHLLYGPGHVEVESRENEGTCVTLRIPNASLYPMKDVHFDEDEERG